MSPAPPPVTGLLEAARGVAAGLVVLAAAALAHPLGAQEPPGPERPEVARAERPESGVATIEGTVRVRPEDGGGALAYAMVTVRDGAGARRTVLADERGAYRVEGVAAGTVRVRAAHVGYAAESVELVVPGGRSVTLELELSNDPLPLREIVVRGRSDEGELADPTEGGTPGLVSAHVRLRMLELSPGLVEAGVGRGGFRPPTGEPGDVLLMRGSTADLKLVLLDGAPVYTPFHLGGLLPGFDPDLFARAEHHTGGAPARYDGGLSYILDLRTRPARRDRVQVGAAVDALSVRGTADVPLGDHAGVLVAGRALHPFVGTMLFGRGGSPYGYRDALVRVDGSVGGSVVGVTGFSNRESVHLELGSVPESGPTSGVDTPEPGLSGGGDAHWGNDAVSGFWRGSLGDLDLEVTGAFGRYRAGLPLRSPVQPMGPESPADSATVFAWGRTDRTRFSVDAARPWGPGTVQGGLTFDRIAVVYGAVPTDPFGDGGRLDASGRVLGGYVEGVRPITESLDLELGARLDHFDPGGIRAAPRITLLWQIGETARLTLTGGRYHQLARRGGVEADLGTGDAVDTGTGAGVVPGGRIRAGALLQVASADHLVGTLEQRIGESVHLTTALFLKDFRDVPGVSTGHLASSGADIQVLHRAGERTAWLGYSLAWFWEPEAASGRFSGRHLLSAGLRTPLIGPAGAALGFSYSDGLPLTAIRFDADAATTAAATTMPAGATGSGSGGVATPDAPRRPVDGFLRLDAELFAEWTTGAVGREARIRPYLRVLNALDRRDALFHHFEPWREESLRPLVEVPLLPVLGVEVRF